MDHGSYPNMKRYLLWIIMTLIILAPSLYSGFPLMFSDTGTYVRSGFELIVPPDRPIMYGLFVQLTSGSGTTLWGPIIVQAFLAALLIWRIWHAFFPLVKAKWFMPALLLLSLGSGLGWHGGRLLPDVFIPLALLGMLDLLFGSPSRPWRLFYITLIIFAGAVHFSSLYVFAFALLLPIALILSKKITWHATAMILAAMGLSVLLTMSINRHFTGEAFVSRSGSLFLTGRLLDTGLLHDWLPSYCASHEFYLCEHTNDLPPRSQALLWGGPVDEAGGWEAVRDQSVQMVKAYFSNGQNLLAFVREGVFSALDQLTRWGLDHEIISQWYRTEGAPPFEMVKTYFPHQLDAFLAARQNGGNGELTMGWVNLLHHLLLATGAVLLIVIAVRPSAARQDDQTRWISLFLLLSVILAAGFSAAVSMPDQRFLARVSWVVPLLGVGLGLRAFLTRS